MKDKIDVAKALIRKDQKFLVVKERESEQWELPGGKLDGDEERFDAATREVEEETGLHIEDWRDVVRVELESSEIVNCWIVFAETGNTEVELYEEELIDYRWVTPEEFRTMDWHADAGYGLPAMVFVDDYLG